jgi:hypothetical protein
MTRITSNDAVTTDYTDEDDVLWRQHEFEASGSFTVEEGGEFCIEFDDSPLTNHEKMTLASLQACSEDRRLSSNRRRKIKNCLGECIYPRAQIERLKSLIPVELGGDVEFEKSLKGDSQ